MFIDRRFMMVWSVDSVVELVARYSAISGGVQEWSVDQGAWTSILTRVLTSHFIPIRKIGV